jgi:activator of 2-hydroxyglutaryl-CoA dehydratase
MVSEGLRRCATEDLKRQMSEYSLGIDIGGTFTDLVIHDHDSGWRWEARS